MTTLYRYSVGTNVYEDGVTAFPIAGEAVEVDGQPMVRMSPDYIQSRDGWHETQEAALAAAADQIGRMALRLLDQASNLRIRGVSP